MMKIPIDNTKSIREIQETFSGEFPYLKLEFSPAVRPSVPTAAATKTANRLVGEFRSMHNYGEMDVSPQMTVTELELLFRNDFGLIIRVFRKSGKIWLETGFTNNWTLEKQNAEAESLSRSIEERRTGLAS